MKRFVQAETVDSSMSRDERNSKRPLSLQNGKKRLPCPPNALIHDGAAVKGTLGNCGGGNGHWLRVTPFVPPSQSSRETILVPAASARLFSNISKSRPTTHGVLTCGSIQCHAGSFNSFSVSILMRSPPTFRLGVHRAKQSCGLVQGAMPEALCAHCEPHTTNNLMETKAALGVLEVLLLGAIVTLATNSSHKRDIHGRNRMAGKQSKTREPKQMFKS